MFPESFYLFIESYFHDLPDSHFFVQLVRFQHVSTHLSVRGEISCCQDPCNSALPMDGLVLSDVGCRIPN